jgi:HK97 family phage prohead protease
MPMPTPMDDETLEAYVARFMADPAMAAEYPDEDQRVAVAYVQGGKKYLTYKNARLTRIKGTIARVTPIDDEKDEPNSRHLRGYASVSEIQDLEHDRIIPGAWGKTLQERVASGKVPLMTKHLVSGGVAADTIGWMTAESKEDSIGLWADFVLLKSDLAIEMAKMCKDSLDLQKPVGLSVEFYPVKYEPNEFGGYDIQEAKLIQVTLTTAPCNELSGVYAVKTATKKVYRYDLRAQLARAVLRCSLHSQ